MRIHCEECKKIVEEIIRQLNEILEKEKANG